ncbi:uncharacterized protein LOC111873951 isoform X3 [Cryptotermes secundus]|uniref:uncharacterized protein LOC111873951 isoform X3 n=1 Tax=Cryptotermes secundus TaxID=105785 RepID=UPI001454D080|nr:uncharacterized protein LOC111873951 isoform X3 [Cryptotermes secundus]
MALHKGRIGEIPQGTIQLTEEEAKEYQYRVIFGWTPQREVWPLHYGYGILGACSALSGMYINNYFRSRLRLHTYGRVSSYLPVIALPALMSALFHQQSSYHLFGKQKNEYSPTRKPRTTTQCLFC